MTFGNVGAYEQIDGMLHFAVDAKHPANQSIVDLDLAPKDTNGLTRFKADFSILVPVNANKGNGRAIVELPNRGRRRVVAVLNRAPADTPVAREAHPGDGFLFTKGFSIASIGWQWDVFRSNSLMGLKAPIAMQDGQPITGQTMVEIRPNQNTETWFLADRIHRSLAAVADSKSQAVLYVHDYEDGEDTTVPAVRGRGYAQQRACVAARWIPAGKDLPACVPSESSPDCWYWPTSAARRGAFPSALLG